MNKAQELKRLGWTKVITSYVKFISFGYGPGFHAIAISRSELKEAKTLQQLRELLDDKVTFELNKQKANPS